MLRLFGTVRLAEVAPRFGVKLVLAFLAAESVQLALVLLAKGASGLDLHAAHRILLTPMRLRFISM